MILALIFHRLSKKLHHNKYVLVFPSTTDKHPNVDLTEMTIRSTIHHRSDAPEQSRTINVDKAYTDKLRFELVFRFFSRDNLFCCDCSSSFELSRKYRHKVSSSHPIMSTMDESNTGSTENLDMIGRNRLLNNIGTASPLSSPIGSLERRAALGRLFDSSVRMKKFVFIHLFIHFFLPSVSARLPCRVLSIGCHSCMIQRICM